MTITFDKIDLGKVSKEDKKSIESILNISPYASIFHTVLWNKLLIEESKLRNITLIALSDGNPVAFCTFYESPEYKRKISSMNSTLEKYYTIYGGPISIPGYEMVIPKLLIECEKYAKGNSFLVKTVPNYPIEILQSAGYSYSEALTTIIDLQKGEEELFQNLHRDKRKEIRKAIRSGVTITEGTSSEFDSFYSLYSSLYRSINKRLDQKLNIISKRYCRRIWEEFSRRNQAVMVLGRMGNHITNCIIILCFKDTMYAWIIGTDWQYRPYKVDALAYWAAIKWGNEHGYKFLDLCDINRPSAAIFKRKFGGTDTPFYFAMKKPRSYYWNRLCFYLSHHKNLFKRICRR